jgi:hypothetical protein
MMMMIIIIIIISHHHHHHHYHHHHPHHSRLSPLYVAAIVIGPWLKEVLTTRDTCFFFQVRQA